jgi:hypothetical protein
MVARARLCEPGQLGVDPDGDELPILGGDVQFDSTADVRSTLSLETSFPWPTADTDLFNPYGAELFIERGIVYGDGVREWVAQGYFRIYEIGQPRAPHGTVTVTAKDRMSALVDARTLEPVEFAAGASAEDMYNLLVLGVLPSVTLSFDFDVAAETWDGNHVLEEDRFKFLRDVTQSFGKVMFFSYDGSSRVESVPDPTVPVWTVNHGRAGVLVGADRKLTREGVYNGVVAMGDRTGEGDAAPVRGIALDLDPASPTYWNGGYGQVPRYYSSSFIKTEAQAVDAAEAMLLRAKGFPYEVSFSAIPNPALEALDPVLLTYDDRSLPEVYVLDRLTMPLLATSAMSATTRKVKEGQD